ncbi:hypothetical protein Tco_1573204, partial [Tanacetum coccineum]
MSSPNRSTSDIKDAFSFMNILNYTSASSDYFPTSPGSISFNSSEYSNIIPSLISPFYNNPYLKDNISSPKDTETPLESTTQVSLSSSMESSSPIRSTISPPDYLFNESIFMPPKRASTSAAPAMTQAAIRQLITDGIASALEVQAVAIVNA